jgi:lathosterol oxidase
METHAKFTFGDQVWDNMFWTLAWGVPIWTAYECGLLWMLSQGMIPGHDWDAGPIWFIAFSC